MKKLSLNCGSCLFLNNDKIFERKCGELGKLPTSKGCGSHRSNPFLLIGDSSKLHRLQQIATAVRDMSNNELQALAALLNAERRTRKYGWKFYQRVYIRYTGAGNANYFSNFAVGHVVYADKDTVRIVGDSGKMLVSAINDKSGTTVYTVERFKELAAEMTKKRQFTDPASPATGVVRTPAKLDDVLADDRPLSKKLVKSKTKADDLVSIVAKMSMGFGLKPQRGRAKATHSSGREQSEITMEF